MSLISPTRDVTSASIPWAIVASCPESELRRAASEPACSVRAARAAVEVGLAATSCQADQKRDMTVPRPASDGSGKTVSTFDSSSRLASQ